MAAAQSAIVAPADAGRRAVCGIRAIRASAVARPLLLMRPIGTDRQWHRAISGLRIAVYRARRWYSRSAERPGTSSPNAAEPGSRPSFSLLYLRRGRFSSRTLPGKSEQPRAVQHPGSPGRAGGRIGAAIRISSSASRFRSAVCSFQREDGELRPQPGLSRCCHSEECRRSRDCDAGGAG